MITSSTLRAFRSCFEPDRSVESRLNPLAIYGCLGWSTPGAFGRPDLSAALG